MPTVATWASRQLAVLLRGCAMDLHLQLDGSPGGHAPRRGGTLAANSARAAGLSAATEKDIDMHFKWRLKQLLQEMSVHYTGLRPLRERLAVTSPI